MLDGVELGAERRVDHAAAELHDQPADNRRIDLYLDLHVLLGNGLERVLDRGEMRVGRLLGHSDRRPGLALVLGDQLPEASDHVRRGKQPAVKTGLRTSRWRSGLSAINALKRSRSAPTASMACSSSASSNSAVA